MSAAPNLPANIARWSRVVPSPRLRPTLIALALAVVALAWLATLQHTIGAANDPHLHPSGLVDPLMDDSGEFVVAWHTWGVTHPPGYPLLNALGNTVVRLLTLTGLGGVTSASLVSWLCALAALAILAWLVGRAGGSGWGPAVAVLLAGFGLMTWLYASVAEAYALGLLLGFGMVALAWGLGQQPTARRALALGLVVGLAAGHHRTLLALLPAVALAAWPARRLGWRVWFGAAALAVASLAVYAYLPLAALSGSPWVYGRSPATWDGLLDAVLAREYGVQLAPPITPTEIAAALSGRFVFALEENAAAVALGLIGGALSLMVPRTRRLAAVLGLVAMGYFLAPVGQYLVVGTHMLVMAATVALAGTAGLGVVALDQHWPGVVRFGGRTLGGAGIGLAAVAVIAALWLSSAHFARVTEYSHDPSGERLIAAAATIMRPPNPTFVEAWGPRYFALAYGKYGDKRLADIRLVDARTDLSGLPPKDHLPSILFVPQDFLYLAAPAKWAEKLGAAPALSAAADGLVSLRWGPEPTDGSAWPPLAVTDSGDVALVASNAWFEDGYLRVWLMWRAERRPERDYHVFVKVTGRGPYKSWSPVYIEGDPLTAQADLSAPVYGFSPTSSWQSGDLVEDQFRVPWRSAGSTNPIAVGLYTQGADGAFVDHLRYEVELPIDTLR